MCVAGILRERMLFNMSEAEWDPVIETHLKGTFTVFRAAAPIFREQKSGTMVGFTSGAFAASVAQANYSAAKGGIVSLVRSAAAGMNKYGVTANCRSTGAFIFIMDLIRPKTVEEARKLVETHVGSEPAVLQRDFFNSLPGRFETGRDRGTVETSGPKNISPISVVSDRHAIIFGHDRRDVGCRRRGRDE